MTKLSGWLRHWLELVFGIGLVLVKPLFCYVSSPWGERKNLSLSTAPISDISFTVTSYHWRKQEYPKISAVFGIIVLTNKHD
jgi:hypothetical protein